MGGRDQDRRHQGGVIYPRVSRIETVPGLQRIIRLLMLRCARDTQLKLAS
jgi:hypothetical protein